MILDIGVAQGAHEIADVEGGGGRVHCWLHASFKIHLDRWSVSDWRERRFARIRNNLSIRFTLLDSLWCDIRRASTGHINIDFVRFACGMSTVAVWSIVRACTLSGYIFFGRQGALRASLPLLSFWCRFNRSLFSGLFFGFWGGRRSNLFEGS
jgi:hypothetical protein